MKKQILLFLFILPAYYAPCQVMKLTSGLTLELYGNVLITLDNLNFETDSTYWGYGSRIVFSGNQNTSISGTGLMSLGGIGIAKTGGAELVLIRNIIINGSIFFTSGLLNLNNNNLKLGWNSELYNESETSHIYGDNGGFIQIETPFFGTPNYERNPGRLGLIISNTHKGMVR